MNTVQIHNGLPSLVQIHSGFPHPSRLSLAALLFHDAERRARDGRTPPPTIRHFTWEARA